MLNSTISREAYVLDNINEEMNYARKFINNKKIKRDQLRNGLAELYKNCGILDKPVLLIDYDCIVDTMDEKNREIDKIKLDIDKKMIQITEVQHKIENCKENGNFEWD